MDNPQSNKPNNFVRCLSILLLALLGTIVACHFLLFIPSYSISNGMITIIGFMILLVLAESFGYLSFAKILILSRRATDAEKDKSELKRDNDNLRNTLIGLATTVNQSQQTTNFNGLSLPQLQQMLGVIPSEAPITKEKEDDEKSALEESTMQFQKGPGNPRIEMVQAESNARSAPQASSQSSDLKRKQIYEATLEEYLLFSFIKKYNLSPIDLQKEVQFGAGAESIDPIMDRRTVFDGFIRTQQKEYFIDVRPRGIQSPMYIDRIYVMLAKILFYRQAKRIEAELVLVHPQNHVYDEPQGRDFFPRIRDWFKPALVNGLLRIESIYISPEDYENINKQVEAKLLMT